ncbi:hypothetical protein SRABI128_04700 [Microbacterium sp. Bi128]|nr:hypothetical protein SRABI128_04700 [Microbacterium sp. Bi128]
MAAAVDVVVSPWTTTASGLDPAKSVSRPSMVRVMMADKVWPCRRILRSWSGTMPNSSLTWSSISRCCPVTVTMQSKCADSCRALTIGAILMASGLVPKIGMMLCMDYPPAGWLWCNG